MRVAFVTTDWERVRNEDQDRELHDRAWAAAGEAIDHVAWWDRSVEWNAYDLVVIRSPWDYSERIDEFLTWLDGLGSDVRLHNPAAVVRWNLDKRYLADLEARDVPVIHTKFLDSEADVEEALFRYGDAEIVLKPNVSAGSRHTGRFVATNELALDLARTILREGKSVMLQPCAKSVADVGEVSLVYFDGHFSHAFRKGPILAPGGGLLGGGYRETITPVEPSSSQRRVAEAASVATTEYSRHNLGVHDPLLYARYDLIELDDGSTALLEAELFEPSFFLSVADGAAERFRDAVMRRSLQSRSAHD